jgi:hypothetical protein
MGRHLEGAHFEQAQSPRGAVWRVEFVDAEFGAMVLPVTSISKLRSSRSISQGGQSFAAARRSISRNATSSSRTESLRASSMRGA